METEALLPAASDDQFRCAVLVADVCGYPRLMCLEERATHARIKSLYVIETALIVLIMRRSETADAGTWRGSVAAAWTGGASD